MAEATEFMFKHSEVITALIKHQGLHEGKWQLAIRFAFAAASIGASERKDDLLPSAVASVASIGLQRTTEDNNLVVDASVVNPAPKAISRGPKLGK
jgi:hypothetical protein